MSRDIKIFDGHNDTIKKMFLAGKPSIQQFLSGGFEGHLDMPRMKRAGFAGGFFAICVPAHIEDSHSNEGNLKITQRGYEVRMAPAMPHAEARAFTKSVIAFIKQVEQQSNGDFCLVKNMRELAACTDKGNIAAILHFEGAEAIGENLEDLQEYYDAGLRSIGLVWSRPNVFGEGVPFKFPYSPDTGPGLTDAGKQLVRVCNEMGILIDLAHINEKGFWDVAKLSTKPLVVTHTGVHAICPSTRNLTDKQIDAVGASDGIIGVYFEAANIRRDGKNDADVPLSILVEHITYLINRIGIEYVGLGADYDGALMVADVSDVSGLPTLIKALNQSGLSEQDIRKLAYDNWMRVLGALG